MSRFLTLSYSATVYAMFLGVILYTVGFVANAPFLPKTIDSGTPGEATTAVLVNVFLIGLFGVQHSVMARRRFKRWWTRIVPEVIERSTYVLASSAVLALLLWQWRPLPALVWNVENPAFRTLILALCALGWAILVAATFLIGHLELLGLQQAIHRWRGKQPKPPDFRTPGLYQMVRHPISLGFMIGFWATPKMSQGHLLFAIATTIYILVGTWFEERDLVAQFGERYRDYRRRVPMLVPFWRRARRDPAAKTFSRERG